MRRLVVIAWVLPVLLAAANAAQAHRTERDSVVSYFRDGVSRTDSSSWISSCEWHVYDPARRADRLLLTLPGRAQVVQWDTTFTSVCFTVASVGFTMRDSIYRCDWHFGARPRLVGVEPPPKGSTDYWFNPDSARWQASLQWPVAGGALWRRELWQADRRGREWRPLRGDSVIVDPVDGPEEWAVAAAMRHEPGVSEPGAQQDLDRLNTEAVWFDTSTVRPYAGASRDYPGAYWYFLPFRAAPGMGFAFRLNTDMEPEVSAPIFVVGLGRHTKHLLSSADPDSWCAAVHFGAERRGYAFASFCFDGPRIVDVHTGEIVFEGGPDTRDPTWVLAPLR